MQQLTLQVTILAPAAVPRALQQAQSRLLLHPPESRPPDTPQPRPLRWVVGGGVMSRCFDGCLRQLIHRKIKMMNIYKTIQASKIIELILDSFFY